MTSVIHAGHHHKKGKQQRSPQEKVLLAQSVVLGELEKMVEISHAYKQEIGELQNNAY